MKNELNSDILSKEQKLLVTGASGFIGRNCCRSLINNGFDVIAIIRSEDKYLESLGVKCIITDLFDSDNYIECIAKSNIIIHCAGDAKFGNGNQYLKSNVELTELLVSLIEKSNKKLNDLFSCHLLER